MRHHLFCQAPTVRSQHRPETSCPMMPRITPWRVVKTFAFAWVVMIWLWLALPSNPIPPLDRGAHIQNTLTSGKPLVTVHDWDQYFNLNDSSEGHNGYSLIIKWQLASARTQQITLRIDDQDVNLSSLVAQAEELNQNWKSERNEWVPVFGDSLESHNVPIGDTSAVICPSWIHSADRHLITQKIHGEVGGMVLRAVVTKPGVVEIWKDAFVAQHINDQMLSELNDENLANMTRQRQKELFAKIIEGMRASDPDQGRLASFDNVQGGSVRAIVVKDVTGDLPSTTYWIRKIMTYPVGSSLMAYSLTLFYIYIVFSFLWSTGPVLLLIALKLGLAAGGITISCWLRDGKPPFGPWSRRFWLTRWFHRSRKRTGKHVWGPSGPILQGGPSGGSWDGEDKGLLQRPSSVRLAESGSSV